MTLGEIGNLILQFGTPKASKMVEARQYCDWLDAALEGFFEYQAWISHPGCTCC